MSATILIVPGLHGAPPEHWLSWLEHELAGSQRVEQDDWNEPVLAHWAGRVKRAIDRAAGPVWIVAHGFGCLAALLAACDRTDRVAGALLVAPADPERYSADGPISDGEDGRTRHPSVSGLLPQAPPGFTTLLVAHDRDPDMRLISASQWAERWGSRLVLSSALGDVDPALHTGPWPQCLRLFRLMHHAQRDLPLGSLAEDTEPAPRRHGWLAKLRRQSRATL